MMLQPKRALLVISQLIPVILMVVLLSSGSAFASHCWNVVSREGEVSTAESVDNGQFLELGNNLHWIVGYVNGVWTTLRPDRVRSVRFSRWDAKTANMPRGCTGTVTTMEGETGKIEVPETIEYHVETSLMIRSHRCQELSLVARCGHVPEGVLDKAIENVVVLANPEGSPEDRGRQKEAIKKILDPQGGLKNAETLLSPPETPPASPAVR